MSEPAAQPNHGFQVPVWPAGALVLLLGVGVYVSRRRLSPAAAVLRVRSPSEPSDVNEPALPDPRAEPETFANGPQWNPFTFADIAIVGAGAEGAARYLVLQTLTDGRFGAREVMVTRSEAWRLFGLDAGDLAEERIPGLTIIEDFTQIQTYLCLPHDSSRLVITREAAARINAKSFRQQGTATVIHLTGSADARIEVLADGAALKTPVFEAGLPDRLELLSIEEAFAELMRLPKVDRRM
ncbi:hypothetical protein [Spirillospora sp. NPDC047279]|uniref:hypothetical protein n=1 Tax=Spirillospora sp. NPDC047279 TaxID=3155478 RepID=UPI0033E08F83